MCLCVWLVSGVVDEWEWDFLALNWAYGVGGDCARGWSGAGCNCRRGDTTSRRIQRSRE